MGWVGKIIWFILALGVLAILADIVTWIYEIAWVIPIILVLIVLLIIWKRSLGHKKGKIKKLVKAALVDGKITPKEKQTIITKAMKSGLTEGEAEIYVESIIHQMTTSKKRR